MPYLDGKYLAAGSVDTTELADLAVEEGKIGALAVTAGKIGANAVTEAKINSGAVTEGKLGALSVTEGKIGALAVTEGKLAANCVTNAKIAASEVIDSHLAASAKIAVLEYKIDKFFDKAADISAGSGSSVDVTDKVFSASATMRGGGNASTEGIVDIDSLAAHAKCEIKESSTNDPIEDSSNRQVFGKLNITNYGSSKDCVFTNNSATVTGTGFDSGVSVGDYITHASGEIVGKVQSIESALSLTLTAVYAGANGSSSNMQIVTFDLEFYVDIAGTDTAHSMNSETIDLIFPESMSYNTAPYGAIATGIGFMESLPADHTHDDRYFTETELGATTGTSGGARIGVDSSGFSNLVGTDAQTLFTWLDTNYASFGAGTRRYDVKTIATEDVIPALSYTPKVNGDVEMVIIGGIEQENGVDYTVSGTTVTWNGSPTLDVGTKVLFKYFS